MTKVGDKYVYWTVESYSHADDRSKKYWNCICKCGVARTVRADRLIAGLSKSCGCLERKKFTRDKPTRTLPYGEANFNALYGSYKRSAKRRNFVFDISKENFKLITKNACFYCGSPPLQEYRNSKTKFENGPYIYNGLDRVDSNFGYTVDNVVAACGICNVMKMSYSQENFVNQAIKIADHFYKKGENDIWMRNISNERL